MTALRRRRKADRSHILMIGNNGTPTDRRVWLECIALRDAGFAVSVVSPGLRSEPPRDCIQGIDIYRYRLPVKTGRKLGFVVTYVLASLKTARLAWTVWRNSPFAAIQACNPPDIFFLVALLFRPLGVRFVFDQHDLCPEIYRDRFPDPSPKVLGLLLLLERWTHRAADRVITVNGSCRQLLLSRTSTAPSHLGVVRTGPDLARLRLGTPSPGLKRGRRYLCSYLGVMGPQDGVDLVLQAIDVIVHDLGRDDVQFVLMGDGDRLPSLRELARSLAIDDWVDFTGWADDQTISTVLSTSDLGLQPDRRTPFTDLCTMLKTVEYLAFGLPVVCFDLTETRRSAGPAAHYVADESAPAFAAQILVLLDDPQRRTAMSAHALQRSRTDLAWDRQRERYVDIITEVVPRPADAPARPAHRHEHLLPGTTSRASQSAAREKAEGDR